MNRHLGGKEVSFIVCMILIGAFTGCSIKQEVTRLSDPLPKQVCIIEHQAVKEGVVAAIQESFNKHSIPNRLVPGTYAKTNNMWSPSWKTEDVVECDALLFYVANWNWDLANYMYFASIWMVEPGGNRKIAQATYDASRAGGRLDKFISARDKILEISEQMITGKTKTAIE